MNPNRATKTSLATQQINVISSQKEDSGGSSNYDRHFPRILFLTGCCIDFLRIETRFSCSVQAIRRDSILASLLITGSLGQPASTLWQRITVELLSVRNCAWRPYSFCFFLLVLIEIRRGIGGGIRAEIADTFESARARVPRGGKRETRKGVAV